SAALWLVALAGLAVITAVFSGSAAAAGGASTTIVMGTPSGGTVNQNILLTATITGDGVTPTGTVTFEQSEDSGAAVPIPSCTGGATKAAPTPDQPTASCNVALISAGSGEITASFTPASTDVAASTSAPVSLTAAPDPTRTAVTVTTNGTAKTATAVATVSP